MAAARGRCVPGADRRHGGVTARHAVAACLVLVVAAEPDPFFVVLEGQVQVLLEPRLRPAMRQPRTPGAALSRNPSSAVLQGVESAELCLCGRLVCRTGQRAWRGGQDHSG